MPEWMLYALAVGAVLGAVGWMAEHGVRRLGWPVRWVWALVMAATVLVPAGGLLAAAPGPGMALSSAADEAGGGMDTLVLVGWAVLAVILAASLRVSAWTLRSNGRSWRTRRVEGQAVQVSAGFGPGVVGVRRSRIVLPTWVLDAPSPLRRLVVAHEREHVRARDTALLTAGLWLAIMVPWCLPIWWQWHRLRLAVETDCDARILDGEVAPRDYANTLVAIAGRRTRRRLPVPALSLRPAELERRIRLITGRSGPPPSGALALLRLAAVLGLAAVLMLAVALVPRPGAPPSPNLPTLRWHRPTVPAELPRGAAVILSVEPEPEADR